MHDEVCKRRVLFLSFHTAEVTSWFELKLKATRKNGVATFYSICSATRTNIGKQWQGRLSFKIQILFKSTPVEKRNKKPEPSSSRSRTCKIEKRATGFIKRPQLFEYGVLLRERGLRFAAYIFRQGLRVVMWNYTWMLHITYYGNSSINENTVENLIDRLAK